MKTTIINLSRSLPSDPLTDQSKGEDCLCPCKYNIVSCVFPRNTLPISKSHLSAKHAIFPDVCNKTNEDHTLLSCVWGTAVADFGSNSPFSWVLDVAALKIISWSSRLDYPNRSTALYRSTSERNVVLVPSFVRDSGSTR